MMQSGLLLKHNNLIHYFFDKNDLEAKNRNEYLRIINNCISVEQVHGRRVVVVSGNKTYYRGYDGMLTDEKKFLRIKTADCLPILLYDPNIKIIAAVHAGWKGLFLGIVKNTINYMEQRGAQVKDIIIAVGPHIGSCCYKVSYKRIEEFKHVVGGSDFSVKRAGEWYLDLKKIISLQLGMAGILKKNIDIFSICTCCNNNFPSFRRDGKSASRTWSVIGLIT